MKVLFIGNSHTFYNDMPQTFAMLYEEIQHEKVETTMLANPAVDLEWHMKQFFNVRYNLLYGNYDYCIVQQQAHPFPGKNTTREQVLKLNAFCQEAHTKLIVTLPWAKNQSPEDQFLLNNAYEQFYTMDGIRVSPVGKVWMEIRKLYPEINLYSYDGAHASAYGDYLNACTHYAVITQQSSFGLSNRAIDFLQGNIKCPDNSGVINDLMQLQIKLDYSFCQKIQRVVDRIVL
jgi:hypothetical protein